MEPVEYMNKKKKLLVVSFGTKYKKTRENTIGAIERDLNRVFSDYEVHRSFTSQTVIRLIEQAEGIKVDSVSDAMGSFVREGAEQVVVLPTHFMDGREYYKLVEQVENFRDEIKEIRIGGPLIRTDSEEDMMEVCKAIAAFTEEFRDEETAVCFMGHGTDVRSNQIYEKMQELFRESGHDNLYIGTVEAYPTAMDVLHQLKKKQYKKVILEPLMIVAGDHAVHDMAGDDDTSWKSLFEKEGYEVECVLKGMGEIPDIRNLFVKHVKELISSLRNEVTW